MHDGKTFTDFDATFARRLAPFFDKGTASADPGSQESIPPRSEVEVIPDPGQDLGLQAMLNVRIEDILRREMDRCDRYHNMLGLAGFRCDPAEILVEQIPGLVQGLSRELRSSDIAGCLDNGTILVLVPEDIQSLSRLKRRVVDILRRLTGNSSLGVEATTRAYPGGGNTARELLDAIFSGLK